MAFLGNFEVYGSKFMLCPGPPCGCAEQPLKTVFLQGASRPFGTCQALKRQITPVKILQCLINPWRIIKNCPAANGELVRYSNPQASMVVWITTQVSFPS